MPRKLELSHQLSCPFAIWFYSLFILPNSVFLFPNCLSFEDVAKFIKSLKRMIPVTGPRNRTALTILGLTLEVRRDFSGRMPLFNLAKKCVLDKFNRTQLEKCLGDKHVSRQFHQISANHLFSPDLMPSKHSSLITQWGKIETVKTRKAQIIDSCIFLPLFSPLLT